MTTPCRACPLRKLPLFQSMSEEELGFMERFKLGELRIDAGRTILMEGAQSPQFYTVLEGQGLRQKTLEDGRRQVLSFVLPGDLVGLQAVVMGEMRHSVEATVPTTLCVFDRNGLWSLIRNQPQRAYSLTWLAAIEENFLGESLAVLGQRDATQRIAWALVRLFDRMVGLGLAAADGAVPLPYRQQDLADALGLSLVHTNKTLARLRSGKVADWSAGQLRLQDRAALVALAEVEIDANETRPLL